MLNKIRVKITKKDLLTAATYTSNTDCLLATVLKRKGYNDVKVGGCGEVSIGTDTYNTTPDFQAMTIEASRDEPSIGQGYKKSLENKQFTLTLQPRY